MKGKECTLTQLNVGESAEVISLSSGILSRNRLLDLGLVPQTVVEAIRCSPTGDPVAYKIKGAVIALRSEESCGITVRPIISE